jgi:hypothetical protein
MKTWESGGISTPQFFISAVDGGEWSASCPFHFIPRENAPPPHNHWTGGWVGPRANKDAVERRQILDCISINIPEPVVYLGTKYEELF